MKRKVYDKILEWKRPDLGTSAVLVNGACGERKDAMELKRKEFLVGAVAFVIIYYRTGTKRGR